MTLFDPLPAAPPGPLVRVRLTVAYDGRRFRGFALNPGVRTVGGLLSEVLQKLVGHQVALTCAGRTDAGVHAWGQVVTFDAHESVGARLGELQASVNAVCGPEVVIRDAAVVDASFDARFSATGRTYRYLVLNRPVPDPFLAATSWHVRDPLDVRAMVMACDPLIGEHDFSAFCRRPKVVDAGAVPSLVRRVTDARWDVEGDGLLRFEISANAFCHQMVRSVVGMLVSVGRGRIRAGEVTAILRAGDRAGVPVLAPPHGLCLWAVHYAADDPAPPPPVPSPATARATA